MDNLTSVSHISKKYSVLKYDPTNKESMISIIKNMVPKPDDEHLDILSNEQLNYFLYTYYNNKYCMTRDPISPFYNKEYINKHNYVNHGINNKKLMIDYIKSMNNKPDDEHLSKLTDEQLKYFISCSGRSRGNMTRYPSSPYYNMKNKGKYLSLIENKKTNKRGDILLQN